MTRAAQPQPDLMKIDSRNKTGLKYGIRVNDSAVKICVVQKGHREQCSLEICIVRCIDKLAMLAFNTGI